MTIGHYLGLTRKDAAPEKKVLDCIGVPIQRGGSIGKYDANLIPILTPKEAGEYGLIVDTDVYPWHAATGHKIPLPNRYQNELYECVVPVYTNLEASLRTALADAIIMLGRIKSTDPRQHLDIKRTIDFLTESLAENKHPKL